MVSFAFSSACGLCAFTAVCVLAGCARLRAGATGWAGERRGGEGRHGRGGRYDCVFTPLAAGPHAIRVALEAETAVPVTPRSAP